MDSIRPALAMSAVDPGAGAASTLAILPQHQELIPLRPTMPFVPATAMLPAPPPLPLTRAPVVLVEHRRYQGRKVFGGHHLRALLHVGTAGASAGAKQVIPMYLPDAIAEGLPTFPRFAVRVAVEAHFAVDSYETHPVALRVMSAVRW